jgi:hypothetical protein
MTFDLQRHQREKLAAGERRALEAFYAWRGDGADDPAHCYERATAEARAGSPWLLSLARAGEIDEESLPLLLLLRKRWLDEFRLAGTLETLLVDQALLALYHQLRLNGLLTIAHAATRQSLTAPRAETTPSALPEETGQPLRRLLLALASCHGMIASSLRHLYGLHQRSGYILRQGPRAELGGENSLDDEPRSILT